MKKSEQEWAENLARKYDIFPSTVIHIMNNLVGRLSYKGRYMTKRKRAEEFFELYFEGRKDE